LLRMASGTAVLQLSSSGAGFLLSVILARALGRAGYGVYALAIAWSGFLALPAILGFDRFLVRGLAVYVHEQKWALVRGLLRRSNELVLAASCAIAGIAVIACLFLSPALRIPFALAMLLVPLTNITLVRQSAMQALRQVVRGQLPEFLIKPWVLLVAVGALRLVAPSELTSVSAVGINTATGVLALAVGAMWLRRALPEPVRHVRPTFITSEWVHAALPMMLVSGIWAVNSYVSVLVVGGIGGARDAAVYNLASTSAALSAFVLVAANVPLAPEIARLFAQGDRRELQRTTVRVARVSLLASVPIVCAFALFPGAYLGLFGRGFGSGATAVTILALGQLVNAAAGPAGNLLLMTGHERSAAFGVGVGFVANLVITLVCVPLFGVTGGAIGATASLVIWNLALVLLARRRLGINPSVFGGRSLKSGLG
jgi:O-antigen/teichoic acid export membrane protein